MNEQETTTIATATDYKVTNNVQKRLINIRYLKNWKLIS